MYRFAIGGNNGIAGNTDLSNNILGLNALGNRQPSAVNNVAIGFNSCGSQSSVGTSGGNNVSIGVGGLTTLTSGSYNIGLGANALGNILTGNNNIGIGQNALKNTAIGNNNIVVGSNGSYSVNNNYCVNWVGRPGLTDASWSAITSGYVDDRASTIYGNTVFVAVGASGSKRAAMSFDGITWTTRDISGNPNAKWSSVTYGKVNDLSANNTLYLGKSIFVACADTSGGSNLIMTSIDGSNNWTSRTAYADSTNRWTSITYGLVNGVGTFVACSNAGINRIMTSTDGITWTGRTAYADTSNNYTCITYGNGVFVALASYGLTPMYLSMASSDGITWRGVPTVNDNVDWVSVTYGLVNGQGLFVAVSDSMAPNFNVMTSTTGYSWTQRYITNTSSPWVSVTYGSLLINGQTDKGLFVAVAGNYDGAFPIGGSNHVMVSTDGINWINRRAYADTSANWYSVGYGVVNGVGRFVALAYSQQSSPIVVMTSDIIVPTISNIESNNTLIGYNTSIQYTVQNDLSVWTKSVAPYLSTSNSWYGVAYGLVNGVDTYVGVLRTGSKRVVYSNDAVNWRLIDVSGINGINGTTQWNGIAYGNGRFVAVGNTRAMTSIDGSNNWTAVGLSTQLTNTTWTDIVYGNGKFVAVGNTSTTSPYYRVMTSTDGSNNWTPATDTSGNWTSITYGNGVYVAVANGGTNRVMTSVDGSNNWTGKTVPLNNWNSVAYGLVDTSGVFVAVAQSGTNRVIRSIDNGNTWLSVASIQDTSAIWTGVTYGLVNGTGIFAACAGNNVATSPKYIMTSPDGIIWTGQSGYATNALVNGYVNGRSTFVGVGDIGAVYSQEDTFSNSTAIGTNAQITASNQIVLGTANEMVVCPGGKVGIGTTTAGYYPLNVKGGLGRDLSGTVLALQNAANDYTGATTDIEFSNSNSIYRLGKISAIDIQSTYNSIFLGALALSCGYNVGYIEGIRIKPNPNVSNSALVGIGTTNPAYTLDVSGQVKANNLPCSYFCQNGDISSNWVKVGVFNAGQGGRICIIKLYAHSGYSADVTQSSITTIFFKTSNTDSNYSGFYGDSCHYTHGCTSPFDDVSSNPIWIANPAGVNATTFTLYLCLGGFNNSTFYTAEVSQTGDCSWTPSYQHKATPPSTTSSSTCFVSVPQFVISKCNVGIGTPTSPYWLLTILANRTGYICNSTSGYNGGDDIQGKAPFVIQDTGYYNGTHYGMALKMGLYRDIGSAYIQCEYANVGARDIILQPYAGYVGIGTTTPGANLEIQGPTAPNINTQVNITSFANGNTTTNTSTLNFRVQGAGGGMTNNTIVGKYFPVTTGYYGLAFNPNGVNVMNVISNGTVCIGTSTPNPNANLTVSDKIGVVSSLNNVLGLFSASNGNYLHIGAWNEAGSTSKNIVLNQYGGDVGIGTTSPAVKLDVSGSIRTYSNIYLNDPNYNQYGNTTAYPTKNLVVISAGDGTTTSRFNGNGNAYVQGQTLSLKGENINWVSGISYGSEIQIDGGKSALSAFNYGDIRFYTANTQRMVINSAGYVGIGTTNPLATLHVKGTTNYQYNTVYDYDTSPWVKIGVWDCSTNYADPGCTLKIRLLSSNGYDNSNPIRVTQAGGETLIFAKCLNNARETTTSNIAAYWYHTGGDSNVTDVVFIQDGRYKFKVYAKYTYVRCPIIVETTKTSLFTTSDILETPSQTVDSSSCCVAVNQMTVMGNVGIGTTSPAVKLDVSGQVNATSFNVPSDYRIKKNVQLLHDVSYNIDNLKPVTYTNDMTQKTDMGFIAHELQEEFPFLVTGEKDGENNQTVNYIGLIALLVKELQDLKQEVKMLRNQCNHTNL